MRAIYIALIRFITMLIKSADDRSTDLSTLAEILTYPDISNSTKSAIEEEIKKINSGVKGENEAAYELDFHYGGGKNWAVIHDLRLEHNGRVAQIDHILINRLLDVWVCESKRFLQGVSINDAGEFTMFLGKKPVGTSSPIEQNRKHVAVLQSVFDDGLVPLEKRMGFTIKPRLHSLVLVSKNARITRPVRVVDGVEDIIKVDQIKSRVSKDFDETSGPLAMAKLVSSDTLERFARQLTALHKPASFNWHGKFGVSPTKPVMQQTQESAPEEATNIEHTTSRSKLACCGCDAIVSYKVAQFCWGNKSRFGGSVYCYDCQKTQPVA